MNKERRQRLFYLLIALFGFFGAIIIAYVYGWRLSLKPPGVSKVGGIYMRSFPADARIYLDDELVEKRPGIFGGGVFINNLFPKNYKISITAPDHEDWHRNVRVEPSLVTEIKYAVLVPRNQKIVLEKQTKKFWVMDERIIAADDRGNLTLENRKIPGNNVLGWTENFSSFLTEDTKNRVYYLNDLQAGTSTNINAISKKLGIEISQRDTGVILNRTDGTKLLITSPNFISLLDLRRRDITKIATGKNLSRPAESASFISWATFNGKTATSSLTTYDRFTGAKTEHQETILGLTIKLAYSPNGRLGFLQSNGDLYVKNPNETALKKIASDVRDFDWSRDGATIAALENRSIEIFPLVSDAELKYARFNPPNVSGIKEARWYRDKRHLFLNYGDKVLFLDTGDSSLENLEKIVDDSFGAYNAETNKFYFLKEGFVYSLEFAK